MTRASIRTRFATVEPTPRGCITRFDDGSECASHDHPNDPHYRVISHRTGYGDDTARYALEHDVCHLLIEEALYGRPSRILHGLALGVPLHPKASVYEEMAAQSLQRWIRANERPIIGGVNWDALKDHAIRTLGATS